MTDETANLVLEQLRQIRADMGEMRADILEMKEDVSDLTHAMGGFAISFAAGLGGPAERVERIETRLEPAD